MKRDSALVLFSGGQDSTTCLFWAKQQFRQTAALAFDYRQKHRSELDAARNIAAKAEVPLHILKLDLLPQLANSALTSNGMVMEKEKPVDRPPNTMVEGRNMLFMTYAAVFAKPKGIHHLVTGAGESDFSGYPDCRNDFFRSLNQTLNLSMDFSFTIHTPLMWKNKAETWQLADELGIFELIQNETVTCYNGLYGNGCGECPACRLRAKGLHMCINQKHHG